jgi:hypothetical protein
MTPAYVHFPEALLRGGRDYVHSTDIYDQIMAGAAAAGLAPSGPFDLRIRAKIVRRPRYVFHAGEVSERTAAAQARFSSEGAPWTVLVQEAGEPVVGRRDYDESPAARAAVISDRRAAISSRTGLQPIEAVTALAVYLHKTLFPPPSGRRWILGELNLVRPLMAADATTVAVEIERVSGPLSRSRIEAADGALGQMLFVLG